jgi:hypothetical protein
MLVKNLLWGLFRPFFLRILFFINIFIAGFVLLAYIFMVVFRLTIIGWRRFCVCAGRNRAAVSRKRKNVGEQNATKGVLAPKRTPGWRFANPEPPSGGEALTVCYVLVCLFIFFVPIVV